MPFKVAWAAIDILKNMLRRYLKLVRNWFQEQFYELGEAALFSFFTFATLRQVLAVAKKFISGVGDLPPLIIFRIIYVA